MSKERRCRYRREGGGDSSQQLNGAAADTRGFSWRLASDTDGRVFSRSLTPPNFFVLFLNSACATASSGPVFVFIVSDFIIKLTVTDFLRHHATGIEIYKR